MTDQNLTPEAVERVASVLENELRRITGISDLKSMEASLIRALAQQNAALKAEVERLTKERDHDALTREGILQKRINDLLARAEKAEAERDEALASIAAVRNEAVDWLAARLVDWWGKSNLESNEFLAEFIPAAKANIPDAQAALRSMLADAERDMRQRAAKVAREAWRDGYDATPHILALPLKHADREGGV